MSSKQRVVVVGAGVIGLTTAVKLQESGRYSVTVVAEHTPSEIVQGMKMSSEWASPWAGAHWRPWSSNDNFSLQEKELSTFRELMALAESNPETGINKVVGIDLFESLDGGEKPWHADAISDACEIAIESLPDGVVYGVEYTTLVIDVPKYLVYLMNQLTAQGVRIVERRINDISEAVEVATESGDALQLPNPIVVNCTGLGSLALGGVNDKKLYPIRGQTLLVRAPDAKRTITRVGKPLGYVIPRCDGTVIIGGTAERHSWDTLPSNDTTETILRGALDLEPALVAKDSADLSVEDKVADLQSRIISVNVGFRPMRDGGVRLENEVITTNNHGNVQTVHCYGHGGFGYQSSLAYAKAVVELVDLAI
ncbi:hypothetical protein LPJ72_001851 [Coemansia sp. Benny D160-2]|nr:hypothetical protein LPJ72_001851 [Coemansia sp. Benny D160-2]